jgi:hypothetical protein
MHELCWGQYVALWEGLDMFLRRVVMEGEMELTPGGSSCTGDAGWQRDRRCLGVSVGGGIWSMCRTCIPCIWEACG